VRPPAVALLALVAAFLGGVSTLVVGRAAGWLDSTERTVVVTAGPGAGDVSQPAALRSTARPLSGNGFDPARIFAKRSAGVVTIFAEFVGDEAAQGSGFVVSPEGFVLTNSHVVTTAGEPGASAHAEAASSVYVEFADRDRVPATIVGWDTYSDVGLLRVDPKVHKLVPVPLGNSSSVVVGEPVAAIGSPFGNENSLAVGVVSATRRSIESLTSAYSLADAIQTDAPINQGNSGGPLFDARGRVIGINAQIRSSSGRNEGVGFAVPINAAKRVMNELLHTGRVAYAFVGVRTEDLTPAIARALGYSVGHGAIVSRVVPGSGAARAGLRAGTGEHAVGGLQVTTGADVVVAIDGAPVRTSDDLVRIVTERLRPGAVSVFTVVRGSNRVRLAIRLGERPSGGS
jgi:S1-C subfamily serine protease